MRIIAGKFHGHQIETPRGHKTHPMSEKMRGAIFNMLGDIEGLNVLDAYAGSGSLGLEAVSRGASQVQSIESDRQAVEVIKRNIAQLSASNMKATKANLSSWLKNNRDRSFDVMLADPPYDKLNVTTLQDMARSLTMNGIFVLSWPGQLEAPEFELLREVATKNYNDSSLHFYKKVL